MMSTGNEPGQCAGPRLDVRAPGLKLPPNSVDCHGHVFGPREKYPWAANRLYTPPYRTSRLEPPYHDITAFAQTLVAAAPDRLVWGSDWPHVLLATTMPNDGDLVDQIAVWVPDEAMRRRILVDNPERLYGFERA
jgi:predicted TIM-barrel fold metal-dependent hydrolase